MGTVKNVSELSRIDYLILSGLFSGNATNEALGLTLSELEIEEVQRSCLWKHINRLMQDEFVKQSGKYHNQNMYYITESGIQKIGGIINEK